MPRIVEHAKNYSVVANVSTKKSLLQLLFGALGFYEQSMRRDPPDSQGLRILRKVVLLFENFQRHGIVVLKIGCSEVNVVGGLTYRHIRILSVVFRGPRIPKGGWPGTFDHRNGETFKTM